MKSLLSFYLPGEKGTLPRTPTPSLLGLPQSTSKPLLASALKSPLGGPARGKLLLSPIRWAELASLQINQLAVQCINPMTDLRVGHIWCSFPNPIPGNPGTSQRHHDAGLLRALNILKDFKTFQEVTKPTADNKIFTEHLLYLTNTFRSKELILENAHLRAVPYYLSR